MIQQHCKTKPNSAFSEFIQELARLRTEIAGDPSDTESEPAIVRIEVKLSQVQDAIKVAEELTARRIDRASQIADLKARATLILEQVAARRPNSAS